MVSEQAPLPVVTHIGIQGLSSYLIPGFMLVSEQAPLPAVTNIGIQGPGGYVIPRFLLICGLLLWLTPIARIFHSLLAILLALASWITSDLGGLFLGMLLGVVGGALAFAWRTDAEYRSSGRLRGEPRIGLQSWAREVMSRLSEAGRGLHNLGPYFAVHLARLHRDGAPALAAVGALARKIAASARVFLRRRFER
jgi:Family of unknown function (DUF6114)